jgi:leucyl-tRNA synthetase
MHRVWGEFDNLDGGDGEGAETLRRALNKTIKGVTEGLEQFRFNTSVARLHEFVGVLRASPVAAAARRESLSALARLIAPFTPHLAEACWERLGERGLVAEAPWPEYDPALAADEEKVLPVQINGKRRGEVRAAAGAAPDVVERIALEDPDVQRHLSGMTVRKVIVVPDRIINIVAG